MNVFERIIHGILNRLFKRRDIVIDGELYLRRWFIKGVGTNAQWFLHNIRKPDLGRDMHDHPWPFQTRILWGGYVEHTPFSRSNNPRVVTETERSIGEGYSVPATHTHRIDQVLGSTYTLVKAGAAVRTWGFWVKGKWIDWRSYLGYAPDHPDHEEDRIR
jgi:hypothetical protein